MLARPPPERRTRLLLALSFGIITAVLLASQLYDSVKARQVQANVDLIAENSLASTGLVERMGMDVLRERILVQRHIFEQDPAGMDRTERQIAANRKDYADAASRYESLAAFDAERAWRQLKNDVTAAEGPIGTALALSRKNLDQQAREALFAIEPLFDDISRDVQVLVEINQLAAVRALARVKALQRGSARLKMGLAALVVSLALLVGYWVTRVVADGEEQIRRYAEALEVRNRELDAFAGRVAHDLRGPLTTINLSAQQLFKGLPQEQGSAGVFQRGVKRMEQLIEDLLTLSRIEAQVSGMVAGAEKVAASVEEDLAPRVKEIDGELRIKVEPARVRCSEGLLREVLWNLGENAVKYRRRDVPLKIEMAGRASHHDYELRVSDNGPGMSHEEIRRAFEPFFRGEQSHLAQGTGLGLSIVKRIIEASGGTISIDSLEGRGTTFVIRLPLEQG